MFGLLFRFHLPCTFFNNTLHVGTPPEEIQNRAADADEITDVYSILSLDATKPLGSQMDLLEPKVQDRVRLTVIAANSELNLSIVTDSVHKAYCKQKELYDKIHQGGHEEGPVRMPSDNLDNSINSIHKSQRRQKVKRLRLKKKLKRAVRKVKAVETVKEGKEGQQKKKKKLRIKKKLKRIVKKVGTKKSDSSKKQQDHSKPHHKKKKSHKIVTRRIDSAGNIVENELAPALEGECMDEELLVATQ